MQGWMRIGALNVESANVWWLILCAVERRSAPKMSFLLAWYHKGSPAEPNQPPQFPATCPNVTVFILVIPLFPSPVGKGFSSPPRAAVCCSHAVVAATEIKFTWLGDHPGANRMQAARSACYFAHDSSYLSPSLDQRRPVRSGKLGKSAAAASSCRISRRTGTGLLYISHLSFSVWRESQYWRICLQKYVQFWPRSPRQSLFQKDALDFLLSFSLNYLGPVGSCHLQPQSAAALLFCFIERRLIMELLFVRFVSLLLDQSSLVQIKRKCWYFTAEFRQLSSVFVKCLLIKYQLA